jgi:hypothetical protein
MLDRFIYERIRAVQAEANEKIAVEAAAFEGEMLLACVRESIESRQRKIEALKAEPHIRLLATGTRD